MENKKIKVIDLLNMIANKEYNKLPKKIKLFNEIYVLSTEAFNGAIMYLPKEEDDYDKDLVTRTNNLALNVKLEIIEEEILNEKEKEYLRAVIRPFRNSVKGITKLEDGWKQCIVIHIESDLKEQMKLPRFRKETMYKNMELGKLYTLGKLEL